MNWDRIHSIGGRGIDVKLMLEDTNPPGEDVHNYQTTFERRGDNLIISVKITKPGGRTYVTKTMVPYHDMMEIMNAL